MELAARTIRMNLHTLSKLGYILTFAVFLALFGLTVVIGIVGPRPWVYYPSRSSTDVIPIDGNWTISLDATKLNQRINVFAEITNRKGDVSLSTQVPFTFVSSVSGQKKGQSTYTLVSNTTQTRNFVCKKGQEFCDMTIVMNVPYIDYRSYQFNITTKDGLGKGFQSIKYSISVMNSSFTQFELWFRFFFLVTTVVVIILYAVKLRGFEWKDWAIEQRWVAFLLFGLLGYNNPLFPLTVLLDGMIWPFLDQVMLASFLVLLMFFWIIMFDGIRTEPQLQTFKTFYLPKLIMLALFWIAAVVIFVYIEFSQIRNPGVDVYSQPVFLVFYIVMILLLVIYLFWLFYVVFRAISSRNAMPYLSLRLRFFGVFTLLVLVVVIGGVIFGVIGPVSNNAAQLLSFISLLNLYVYTLGFIYFPSKDVIGRAKNSGMVTLQDLDESAAEMDERPNPAVALGQHSAAAPPASSFGGFGRPASAAPGNAPISSTPSSSWRSEPPTPSSGPAPIRINFDGLDEDDEDAHL